MIYKHAFGTTDLFVPILLPKVLTEAILTILHYLTQINNYFNWNHINKSIKGEYLIIYNHTQWFHLSVKVGDQ